MSEIIVGGHKVKDDDLGNVKKLYGQYDMNKPGYRALNLGMMGGRKEGIRKIRIKDP